jgi:hypothetical protein
MPTLRIEHPVPDFDGWKAVFDSDPMDRQGSGVRRYDVYRSLDDPNYVMIDLEFDDAPEAETMLQNLRALWAGAGGNVSSDQQARVVELADAKTYEVRS